MVVRLRSISNELTIVIACVLREVAAIAEAISATNVALENNVEFFISFNPSIGGREFNGWMELLCVP